MSPRDPRRAIPSSELPKPLHPGRQWHATQLFPARYGLYEDYKMPEGYWTVRSMFFLGVDTRKSHHWYVRWDGRIGLSIESIDPPFAIAEALYDAAK